MLHFSYYFTKSIHFIEDLKNLESVEFCFLAASIAQQGVDSIVVRVGEIAIIDAEL